MKDIQSQPDFRRIHIRKVGVKNISYPITVLDKANKTQKTVATFNMYVDLPHRFKGTHMSRFIEILNRFHGEINLRNFHSILSEMKGKLQAEEAHIEIEFPYFLKKAQPESLTTVEYQCKMHGSLKQSDDLILEIQIPIFPPPPTQSLASLPKSLGHWGVAIVTLRFRHFIWIEDLIRLVESVTSVSLADVCSKEHSHAALEVESLTRNLGEKLKENSDIKWYAVTVKNFSEGCNTFASLEWPESLRKNHDKPTYF